MNKNTTFAVVRLQARRRHVRNQRTTDLIEEALNFLLNQPNNPKPPSIQIRNALREARRKLRRREELFDAYRQQAVGDAEFHRDLAPFQLELANFIDHLPRSADRPLLRIAMEGGGAEAIAEEFALTVASARERLSRARGRAWPFWIN